MIFNIFWSRSSQGKIAPEKMYVDGSEDDGTEIQHTAGEIAAYWW